MPAISMIFNRFLPILLLQVSVVQLASAQLPQLTDPQLQWLGDRIFQNECNASFKCLTSWNLGEDFPSLGIGHFIWYRANQDEVFTETFPALIAQYRAMEIPLPDWLEANSEGGSPWHSRQQFLDQIDSAEMQSLRQFLADTSAIQVDFIVRRLSDSLAALSAQFDGAQVQALEASFYEIANIRPPSGLYALIDYVHFKGSGMNLGERYQQQGWGLVQVLQRMQGAPITLQNFVDSASWVLERRVALAPVERNEQRWLQGWNNRLQTYLLPPAGR
jgi:hypothetical protein